MADKVGSKKNFSSAWLIGAAGGIGAELLQVVAENSAHVDACDIEDVKSPNVIEGVDYHKLDCSNESEFLKFANKAVSLNGKPELLVVAAGYVSSFLLIDTTSDEIDKIYLNNFKIVALAMRIFFENCAKNAELTKNIVIVSSNAGLEPRPNQPIYAAMKSAINSLIKSQAIEWGAYNVKINAIAPGTVSVPRNLHALRLKYQKYPFDPMRPLGRIAFPRDLIPIFEILIAKDLLITGQVIVIDGGSSL
jgi:NAD(P)-dependent dehydrogenase (short-subunit alcohol dehydrogenase family)